MNQPMDLTVRRFERNEIILDAEFEIDESQRGQIKFSKSCSSAKNAHTLRVTLSDIGTGGVGIQTSMFLPHMTHGVIRVVDPRASGAEDHESSDEQSGETALFEQPVCVRRCELTSRVPTYLVGMSFEQASSDLVGRIDEFMTQISALTRQISLERLGEMGEGHAA